MLMLSLNAQSSYVMYQGLKKIYIYSKVVINVAF